MTLDETLEYSDEFRKAFAEMEKKTTGRSGYYVPVWSRDPKTGRDKCVFVLKEASS